MSTMKLLYRLTLLSIFFVMTSCVKDMDLDQAQEIVIPPSVALDLIYSTIDSSDFFSTGASGSLVARDEVHLEFLDDDYIRDGLMRADYNFIFENSFTQTFNAKFTFLSENNLVKYRVDFVIPAGSSASPATIDYTEIIDVDEIKAIRESIKMIVEIEMVPNGDAFEGELQLKSKAFYKFEFK